jgi:hypothetical protein
MKYEEDIRIGELEHLQETTVEQQKTEDYTPKTKFLGLPLTWFAVMIALTAEKRGSIPPRLQDRKRGKLRI